MDRILHPDPLKTMTGWFLQPLTVVGDPTGTLEYTSGGTDTLNKLGCRGTSASSWACSSQSYLCGCMYGATGPGIRKNREAKLEEVWGDTPTEQEMSSLPKPDRASIKMGRMRYVRLMQRAATHFEYLAWKTTQLPQTTSGQEQPQGKLSEGSDPSQSSKTADGPEGKSCLNVRFPVGGPSRKGKSELQVYNVGTPFERVQLYALGPFPPSSQKNRYLLVAVDCFTKWAEAFPLSNVRPTTVAEVLVNQLVARHGISLELYTDQGRNFESSLFEELSRLLGIRKTRTTALHPQSDGQVERQHQTILDYLSKYIQENQKDWDRWITLFLLSYRASTDETTGMTPTEMYIRQDLRQPLDLLRGNPVED
ncbi:hypothetical protein KPH14_008502 [Odynerus spinipes]|uniref:Integrase catalytic domain-containing protein n=1 Tax=Odynerus spinipes TaxID=1348599 RepID=A0AAD9RG90_9HYME|nr:hypothetical protein KPH14_008502 [Odynerus spinipes]